MAVLTCKDARCHGDECQLGAGRLLHDVQHNEGQGRGQGHDARDHPQQGEGLRGHQHAALWERKSGKYI